MSTQAAQNLIMEAGDIDKMPKRTSPEELAKGVR